jgi:acyl carrier protein
VYSAIRTSVTREDRVMTAQSTVAGPADPQLFTEIVGILLEVTTESAEWAAGITPNARLEVDLGMESIELAALGELLRRRYGAAIDLPAFVAGLDIDQLIGFSVGELAGYVAAHRSGPAAGDRPAADGATRSVMPDVTSVMPGQTAVGPA